MEKENFENVVNKLEKARDGQNEPLNMHYLLIQEKEQTFLHAFGDKKGPSDIRSISKTVLTLFLGVVIRLSEQGKYPEINEETYIYPIIKNVINLENKENLEKLKKVQIKHLLTHTTGYEKVLLMRQDIVEMDPYDYLDYVVNAPLVHEPGEYYLYSNAGFYLLGVALQEFLQKDLIEVIKKEFFHPLGISEFTWENYGNYIAGATRLWLLPEDLVKFGELLLNKGTYQGQQLITEAWLQKMLIPRIYTPEVDTPTATFRRYAYGYGTWLAKEPIYFGHGTDGQILAVIPEKKAVILTLAEQPDIAPIEEVVDEIIREKL
jgi:CubicO group peptidase (beta-lactamase class C family)